MENIVGSLEDFEFFAHNRHLHSRLVRVLDLAFQITHVNYQDHYDHDDDDEDDDGYG